MSKVKVAAFSVSLDGFGAGPNQNIDNPLGIGGTKLHEWFFKTKSFQSMHGSANSGETGIDNDFAEKSFENIGAWILGRNMFGPVRGPWKDESWKGWWGDDPPYHVPVFVLTHHPRKPIEMKGGTTFYFVTDGIKSALQQARQVSKGKDIRIGGGVSLIRQYLQAELIDEMHLAYSPTYLGSGESLLSGLDILKQGFSVTEFVTTKSALHVFLKKGCHQLIL